MQTDAIWIHADTMTYFQIPLTHQFSVGTYRLMRAGGETATVEYASIEPFIVSEEAAYHHIERGLDMVIDAALSGTESVLGGERQEILGVPIKAASQLIDAVGELLEGTVQKNSAQKADAKQKLATISNQLPLGDIDLNTLPNIVDEFYKGAQDETQMEMWGDFLQAFIENDIDDNLSKGQKIDAIIEQLEVKFHYLLSNEKRDEQRRRQAMQAVIDRDIEAGLRAAGLDPKTYQPLKTTHTDVDTNDNP